MPSVAPLMSAPLSEPSCTSPPVIEPSATSAPLSEPSATSTPVRLPSRTSMLLIVLFLIFALVIRPLATAPPVDATAITTDAATTVPKVEPVLPSFLMGDPPVVRAGPRGRPRPIRSGGNEGPLRLPDTQHAKRQVLVGSAGSVRIGCRPRRRRAETP